MKELAIIGVLIALPLAGRGSGSHSYSHSIKEILAHSSGQDNMTATNDDSDYWARPAA